MLNVHYPRLRFGLVFLDEWRGRGRSQNHLEELSLLHSDGDFTGFAARDFGGEDGHQRV
jgi:hypothetical protein